MIKAFSFTSFFAVLLALLFPASSFAFAHGSAPSDSWHAVGDFLTVNTVGMIFISVVYLYKIRKVSPKKQTSLVGLQLVFAIVSVANMGSFWVFVMMSLLSLVFALLAVVAISRTAGNKMQTVPS